MKDAYLEGLKGQLQAFSTFLGTKSWLVGEQITYPDFHLYEMLTQHKMLKPDCLKVRKLRRSFKSLAFVKSTLVFLSRFFPSLQERKGGFNSPGIKVFLGKE